MVIAFSLFKHSWGAHDKKCSFTIRKTSPYTVFQNGLGAVFHSLAEGYVDSGTWLMRLVTSNRTYR